MFRAIMFCVKFFQCVIFFISCIAVLPLLWLVLCVCVWVYFDSYVCVFSFVPMRLPPVFIVAPRCRPSSHSSGARTARAARRRVSRARSHGDRLGDGSVARRRHARVRFVRRAAVVCRSPHRSGDADRGGTRPQTGYVRRHSVGILWLNSQFQLHFLL